MPWQRSAPQEANKRARSQFPTCFDFGEIHLWEADREWIFTIARTNVLAIQYEIDTPLTKLKRKLGKEKAVRAWRRSRLAVDALAARLGELHVPGVMPRNSLYLAGNILDKDALAREHEARRAAGLASRYLDRKAVFARFGIRREAALLGFGTLVLDPRRTTLALLRAAVANGARIFAPVEIRDVEPKQTGVTVIARNGRSISPASAGSAA